MKAIRVTFKNEDFASVSRSLVDLGVVFQVEPIESDDAGVVAPSERVVGSTAIRGPKKPTKKSGKSSAVSGAAALRAIAERNRATSADARSASETGGIPDDLSEKLLPYGDRSAGDNQ